MVPTLVVLTIVAFLVAQWYLDRRRKRAMWTARATSLDERRDLYFHPGQCWVRATPDGLVSIGASEFASNFAGRVERVELPRERRRLRQGRSAWTLVSTGGRRLTQVMPVSGKVLAVNEALRRDPSLIQRSPYDEGWILRVRPRRLQEALSSLVGDGGEVWHEALRAAVAKRLSPALGHLAYDGGEWVRGFGDLLPDDAWYALRRELFPGAETTEPVG